MTDLGFCTECGKDAYCGVCGDLIRHEYPEQKRPTAKIHE